MVTSETLAQANAKSNRLRELIHADKILIMPGAYDALSARLFEHLGFEAIQGSSGAIAAGLGYQDGERITRAQMIEVTQRMVEAVSVPVNADGEKGYGDAEGTKETVRGLVQVGCAGMNLEDSPPRVPGERWELVPLEAQLEKIEAFQAAKRELGSEFFLNARVDALMVLQDDPQAALREAVRRAQAYAEAGGDCIFFTNAHTREVIGELAHEVSAPISVLAGPATPPVAVLQELGVARVSYGTAFSSVAAGAMRRLSREILESGTITALQEGMPGSELTPLMRSEKADG